MMRELEARLEKVLREVLGLSEAAGVRAMSRSELPEWDSLRHVKLMLELQKEFGHRFSATEIAGLDSFSRIREALLARPQES